MLIIEKSRKFRKVTTYSIATQGKSDGNILMYFLPMLYKHFEHCFYDIILNPAIWEREFLLKFLLSQFGKPP